MTAEPPSGAPLLLYDGACGLCSATVRWVLRRDQRGPLRFASLRGRVGREIVARHAELTGLDSVVWVEPAAAGAPERVRVRSDAALQAAAYLGGAWRLAAALRAVPRRWRDACYDLVARHRHRLFGVEACFVPPAGQRARFLDDG